MYTVVSRGPSRLTQVTASRTSRRGPAQQITLEKFDSRDPARRESLGPSVMRGGRRGHSLVDGRDAPPGYTQPPPHKSSPKPVFNGKRSGGYSRQNSGSMTQEPSLPFHEENVKFVSEAWARIQYEYEASSRQGREGPVYYQEKQPSQIQGFQPFDLEQLRGSRGTLQQST